MKLAETHDGDTYRVAYAALPEAVYVLHVFKKKSKRGSSTPRSDKERTRTRLEAAESHHETTYETS